MTATYTPTARTTPTRHPERATYDRDAVHAVLDEALLCHLSWVSGGRAVVIPTIHARVEDRLYVHGSTGASFARSRSELEVSLAVTLLDGLVLARSLFNHSMNYRSVIVHGTARPVTDPTERDVALEAIVEHIWPGRTGEARPASRKELAATSVLAIDLEEVSLKVRDGGPADEPEDLDGPWWAGVIPLRTIAGDALPSADLAAEIALAPSVQQPA